MSEWRTKRKARQIEKVDIMKDGKGIPLPPMEEEDGPQEDPVST